MFAEKARWELPKNGAINRSGKQHPTKEVQYAFLPLLSNNSNKVCWRCKNELISDVILNINTPEVAEQKKKIKLKSNIHQLCTGTGWREKERRMIRNKIMKINVWVYNRNLTTNATIP